MLVPLVLAATLGAIAPPERLVLLRADAPLYRAAGDDTHKYVLTGPNRWYVARLVGGRGSHVEVALGDRTRRCETPSDLNGPQLRLWARAGDLGHVVIQEHTVTLPDGTGAHLRPGLAVEHSRRGFHLATGPFAGLRLPASVVGRTYLPEPSVRLKDSDVRIREGALARLGPHRWRVTSHDGMSLLRARMEGTQGTHALLRLVPPPWFDRRSCASYLVRVHRRDLTDDPIEGGGAGLVTSGRVKLKPDTPLYWPDGPRAGTADELRSIAAQHTVGERRCYELLAPLHEVRADGPGKVTLCVDPE